MQALTREFENRGCHLVAPKMILFREKTRQLFIYEIWRVSFVYSYSVYRFRTTYTGVCCSSRMVPLCFWLVSTKKTQLFERVFVSRWLPPANLFNRDSWLHIFRLLARTCCKVTRMVICSSACEMGEMVSNYFLFLQTTVLQYSSF